jgi:hypothetical protein
MRIKNSIYMSSSRGNSIYGFCYLNRESLDLDLGHRKDRCLLSVAERKKDTFCYLSSKVLYYLVEKTGDYIYIYLPPLRGSFIVARVGR